MTTHRTWDLSSKPVDTYQQHRQRARFAMKLSHQPPSIHSCPTDASHNLEMQIIDNTMRVLLVEDNPIHAQFLKASLQRCHMVDIAQANSVRQALSFLEQAQLSHQMPSLVLLDLDLPDGSALDVLQSVRSSASMSYLPIVVLSSSDDPLCIGACMKAGANAYMTKMLHPQQLHPFIQHTIGFWRHVQTPRN